MTPVPFGAERLSMMLLRRTSVAVVAVALAVWKRPEVPKLAPEDEAASRMVLYQTFSVELLLAEVLLMPRITSAPLAAGAFKSPIRLLNTLKFVPAVTRMPFTELPA